VTDPLKPYRDSFRRSVLAAAVTRYHDPRTTADLDWSDVADGCLLHDSAFALTAWAEWLRISVPREPDLPDCE
jgi:hypothetical protein